MKQAIVTTASDLEKTAANGNTWEARLSTGHLRHVLREWQASYEEIAPASEEAAA